MKQYKCGFNHCAHDGGKVEQNEAIKINKRYWHKDCYETSELIKEIEQDYFDHISSSVVISYLRKIINDIVYGRKLENKNISKSQSNLEAARYLSYCLKYAIDNNIPITHVPGLYYLIDNARIKKAYEKERDLRIQKKMKESIDNQEIAVTPVNAKENIPSTFTKNSAVGFGSILKGGK
jgi:hypothetical protein